MENNLEQKLTREELRNKLKTKLNVQSFSRLSKKTKEEQIELVKEKMNSMMKKE